VIHCSSEERDKGVEHWEKFSTKKQAINRAKKISNNEFIAVEKHHEIFERNDWLPDWDMGYDWFERIEL